MRGMWARRRRDQKPHRPEAAAFDEFMRRAEEECIQTGPACVCTCPRAAHAGRKEVPYTASGFLGYYDGPCSAPDCPGCPNGYWPGDGTPYEEVLPRWAWESAHPGTAVNKL